MCALLFHMAGIQNDDPVCTDNRGKSVGNHNYCPFSAAAPVGADLTPTGRHAPLRESANRKSSRK